ncbi:MAG: hypothetical protein WCX73_02360 [Candidatus Pacearchaeota archaeon]
MLIIISIPSVFALGVSPGRNTIDFSPNLEKSFSVSILNTESKDFSVALSVEGDLADYISISEEKINFLASESSKQISYSARLPKGLSPGLHKAEILITQVPSDFENSDVLITTTVSVITQLYVYVPYPGKYLEGRGDIVNKGTSAVFYIPIISRGEEKINEAYCEIEIYQEETSLGKIESNKVSIEKGEKKELSAEWQGEPGKYKAVINLIYDGKIETIEKEFNLGLENVDVLGVSVNEFKLGDVAKIKVLVQNKDSGEISSAEASMKIYGSENEKVADIKSETYSIPAKSNKEMNIYWDTESLDKGEYGSNLKINYEDKFVEKNLKIDVEQDSMTFRGVGFVIAEDAGGKMSMANMLYIIIGFLVLINLVWIVWWMRNKKKKKR